MINALKSKIWVFLTSKRICRLIIKYSIKEGFIKTNVGWIKVGDTPSLSISLIFWKLYEREDIKFINKHLHVETPVIELGASLGVTTTNICKKVNQNTRVIAVEANPNLYQNLLETKKINGLTNLEIITAALDYSEHPRIRFSINESTLSSSKSAQNLNTVVPTIKLSDIVEKYNLSEYSLVCDIEGAEIEIILMENDQHVINKCKKIIIELHETSFNHQTYKTDELLKMLCEKFSMVVLDQDHLTFVLGR